MKKKIVFLVAAVLIITIALSGCAVRTNDGASSSSGGLFGSLWGLIAIPLGFIMKYCYIFVNDILHMPLAYVFALFLFALITKILMFPLSLSQQKSSAKMAAFQPMIEEINRTYAKDANKRNEETQKLYEGVGYNPMSGCWPLLVQFPIIFGLVEVIYKPLTYMLRIPSDVIAALTKIVQDNNLSGANIRFIENDIISAVKTNEGLFSGLGADSMKYIAQLKDLDMSIGRLNLWEKPKLAFSLMLLIPLFSIVTMVLSSIITMKTSGQSDSQAGQSGMTMMISSALLFGVFSFTYPAAFSLYWGFQNLIIIIQSFILRKICDPKVLKQQAIEEMKAKRAAKKNAAKAVSTIKVKNENGEVVDKTLTVSELNKLRLQKAREIDSQRYSDESQSETDSPDKPLPEYFGDPDLDENGQKKKEKKSGKKEKK